MQFNRCLALAAILSCCLWTSTAQSDESLTAIERQIAQLDAKLTQLFVISSEQIEALSSEVHQLKDAASDLLWRVDRIQHSIQQVESASVLLVRESSKVANQSDQILLNQEYCANHEALKEMFFEWTAKCSAPGFPNMTTTTPRPSTTQPPNYVYSSCGDAPARSGVYRIAINGTHQVDVLCEQEKHGGGWMVFQSRLDGSVNFNRSWTDFKNGFGTPEGEFWLGLENLYQWYASRGLSELLIVMQSASGVQAYELYSDFGVDSGSTYYKLLLSTGGLGNARDSLIMYRGERFVTYDNGYGSRYGDCVNTLGSAFWHYECNVYDKRNNLNGVYGVSGKKGIWWTGIGTSPATPLTKVQMMIRTPQQQTTTAAT